MAKKFCNDISANFKQALNVAQDLAKEKFKCDAVLWKGDYEIKDGWYSNKKETATSYRAFRVLGVVGVSATVKVLDGGFPRETLAKFYFGFVKKGEQ